MGGCLRGRAVRVGRGGLHLDAWKLLTLESDLTLLSRRTVLLRGVHRAWSLSLRMGCVQEIPLSLRWRVELAGRGGRKHLGDIRFPEDILLKVYFKKILQRVLVELLLLSSLALSSAGDRKATRHLGEGQWRCRWRRVAAASS